ncbi:MAG: nitroreductase [Dehalococcoidales bacterium]
MDIVTAIKKRQSIRAFKPDPVPLDMLKKIIGQAIWAPSWANTQPWDFAVAAGEKLKAIQDGFLNRGEIEAKSEVARPYEFPEPYISRMRGLMAKERTFMSEAEFKGRRSDNFYHYGAPACIYLLVGKAFVYQAKGVNVWPLFDCGLVVENIMLLATSYGLGTVAQAQAVVYPDIIRKVLGIPEDRLLALGIAIGYPDMAKTRNKFRSDREPLEKIATFYGFE